MPARIALLSPPQEPYVSPMSNKFKAIRFPEPSDLIIEQILGLLKDSSLRPGERLPSELVLQQSFQVSKQQLKAAFRRLEIYGVVETRPQSGTYISNFAVEILIALIDNILNMGDLSEPHSLLEARVLIEERAVELACERMNKQDYQVLQAAHDKLVHCIQAGEHGIAQDIHFHLELIRCCRNPVLISSYSMIVKELVLFWGRLNEEFVGNQERLRETCREHRALLEALRNRDVKEARKAMQEHLRQVSAAVQVSVAAREEPGQS